MLTLHWRLSVADIEDIVLRNDRRGIAHLRGAVPEDFCTQAAQFALDHPGRILIATGFYILSAGAPESDGPPGAIVLGEALESLGNYVAYVTDAHTVPIMVAGGVPEDHVFAFPVVSWEESQTRAQRILEEVKPDLLIAIERCGRTRSGEYLNMRGKDISQWTGKLDALFLEHPATIGIGDGGNEVGMGSVYAAIPDVPTLVRDPCDVPATHLVLAAVSNWGGYGVVAALARLTGEAPAALAHRPRPDHPADGPAGRGGRDHRRARAYRGRLQLAGEPCSAAGAPGPRPRLVVASGGCYGSESSEAQP